MNDIEINRIIRKTINEMLDETNLIRPFTDSDYARVNPNQFNLNLSDFKRYKEKDDKYNSVYKEDFGSEFEKINTPHNMFGNIRTKYKSSDGKTFGSRINRVKNRINKKIRQKHKETTGRTNITNDDFDVKQINKILSGKGIELNVNGKTFSYGNSKLPEDIMIVNLTSTFTCPSAENGDCVFRGNGCYSDDLEKTRKELLNRNLRNEIAYRYMSTRDILELLETYIECAPTRIHCIRISEDGDFKNQETLEFCDKIAGHLKKKYGIKTVAYTHRNLDYSNIKNIIINMSDTRLNGGTRYFLARGKSEWDKTPEGLDLNNNTFKCHCDCRKCRFCYNTKEENNEPMDKQIKVIELWRKKGDNSKNYTDKKPTNIEIEKKKTEKTKNNSKKKKRKTNENIDIIISNVLNEYKTKSKFTKQERERRREIRDEMEGDLDTLIDDGYGYGYEKQCTILRDYRDKYGGLKLLSNPEMRDIIIGIVVSARDIFKRIGKTWDDFDDFIWVGERLIRNMKNFKY